jgi:acetyl-CoA/propionyl-CoA carboxylase biotin carboxyl carrier protein
MQATVVKLAVAEGDTVVKGDLILVLEAMKMEQPITAHKDGTIASVNASVGATVSSGHLLLNIM